MVERRRHLGEQSWISEALSEDEMTEPVARVFSSQVGKCGPSLKLGPISELQMVRDPGGRELGRQHLKDPSVVLRAIGPVGDTEVKPDSEVCGHLASFG
jgi:hypothetical protein